MKVKRAVFIIIVLLLLFVSVLFVAAASDAETAKASLARTEVVLGDTRDLLERTQDVLEATVAERNETVAVLEATVAERNKAVAVLEATVAERNKTVAVLEATVAERNKTVTDLEFTVADLRSELGTALTPPYTSISGRELTWAFRLLDESMEVWTLGVDTYRYWIERSEPTDRVTLNTDNGPVSMVDFTKYVKPAAFESVVEGLYEKSGNEWEFAKEAFNIVSQLTVYSADIGEDPRWPLETFTEGGGDCEDLAILFASLLKAAPYPYEVELVYMDSDNPTDPQRVNHVIVTVATDDWRVLSECTNDEGFDYWERVVGWYFDL